jgi:hypothetical protein
LVIPLVLDIPLVDTVNTDPTAGIPVIAPKPDTAEGEAPKLVAGVIVTH